MAMNVNMLQSCSKIVSRMVQVFVALSVHMSVRPIASPSFGPSVVQFVAANSSSRIQRGNWRF